jgi:hypothetical protein
MVSNEPHVGIISYKPYLLVSVDGPLGFNTNRTDLSQNDSGISLVFDLNNFDPGSGVVIPSLLEPEFADVLIDYNRDQCLSLYREPNRRYCAFN